MENCDFNKRVHCQLLCVNFRRDERATIATTMKCSHRTPSTTSQQQTRDQAQTKCPSTLQDIPFPFSNLEFIRTQDELQAYYIRHVRTLYIIYHLLSQLTTYWRFTSYKLRPSRNFQVSRCSQVLCCTIYAALYKYTRWAREATGQLIILMCFKVEIETKLGRSTCVFFSLSCVTFQCTLYEYTQFASLISDTVCLSVCLSAVNSKSKCEFFLAY